MAAFKTWHAKTIAYYKLSLSHAHMMDFNPLPANKSKKA